MTPAAGSPGLPPIHVVTDDVVLTRGDVVAVAERLLEAGGARVAFHLRGPQTPAARLHQIGARLAPVAERSGSRLVVNDRVDVARALGLTHVQLGARSLTPRDARAVLGPTGRVGVSVHSADEARAAAGADWLVVGTLWPTRSHPGRPGAGPDLLAGVAAVSSLPLIAIGGITPARVHVVRAAGGAGVAVLSGIHDAPDPVLALNEYLTAWDPAPVPDEPDPNPR